MPIPSHVIEASGSSQAWYVPPRHLRLLRPCRPAFLNIPLGGVSNFMDKLGTWLAITGVAIGFIVLGWLLFSESPKDKNKKP